MTTTTPPAEPVGPPRYRISTGNVLDLIKAAATACEDPWFWIDDTGASTFIGRDQERPVGALGWLAAAAHVTAADSAAIVNAPWTPDGASLSFQQWAPTLLLEDGDLLMEPAAPVLAAVTTACLTHPRAATETAQRAYDAAWADIVARDGIPAQADEGQAMATAEGQGR